MTLQALEGVRDALPDVAKDIRLNLQAVLQESSLTVQQRWGVAVACAAAARNERLRRAVVADALAAAGQDTVDDALAAAALMAMNNVYYRFRHVVEKETYSSRPARLRMTRIARPATNKLDFELYCLAVSSINNCQACVRSHEKVVTEGGLSEEAVHDAIRIAATLHATAVALELTA
ncbi:MAG: alkyl hydroperoxide reductase [Myxococcales bacterium]|jgi:alkyl hydroperoxide reductase subunit D|nr:alkyl hydroperoxide reductase [Myxococcales bacterium]